ncbi:MAG TPA: adenylate/guanylate cyclase domain-containing protein [Myxococcales bacterium]
MARPTAEDRIAYLKALCRTIPYTVVEPVLAEPSELSVTPRVFDGAVMHADLVGFTALCEAQARSGPEGLMRLTRALNELFAHLLEDSLFPYDGYVLHFGGDSVTVFFHGADAVLRAAAAALHAQEKMRTDLRRLMGEDQADLLMRVGLAAGRVELPIVGDLTQRAVICSGATAHRAVELQERAEPGTVRVDSAVVAALGELASLEGADAERATLLSLRRQPPRSPVRELVGRVEEQTEKKIALLEPFVAPPLAARLKSTPNGWRIEGELRQVCVVFAELTGLHARSQPAVTLDVSRSILRTFRKYGGLVAKADLSRRGHRVMVLYGLHLPAGNDVERALLASIEATTRMRGFAASSGPELELRVGVHAGQVYYGAFGSDYRHDITVMGDAVNTAARALQAADRFEVLVTASAAERAGTGFVTTPQDPLHAKGKSHGLELKLVHGTAEGRAHYMRARGSARYLAGRSAEVTLMKQVVGQALGGAAQVLGITGAEGTGKSAILSELVDEWVRRGGTGLLGRCRYATRTEPLAPIVSMFSAALGLAGSESDSARRDRIREGFGPLAEQMPELMELLQPVRRPDGTSEALVDLADTHARERVLAELLMYLERRSSRGREGGSEPVLFVLEDLHLADGLTLELASRIWQLPRDRQMLVVATYRPDSLVAGFRRAVDHELALEPLAASQSQDLVCHELGATTVDAALVGFLQRRTGGNPGHLVDVVRFLRERGLLPVRAGLATVPEGGVALLDDVVPQTAATVALARLDGLGEIERRLLRTASAFGRSFPGDLLAEVTGEEVSAERVGAAMENLEDLRFIAAEGAVRGWAFRDEVTRAVAYGSMTEPRRREVHQRIADALQRRPDLDPQRDAAGLALHRERAGQFAEAAGWYEKAALAAFTAGLEEEVQNQVEHWERCAAETGVAPQESVALRMGLLKLVSLGRRRRQAETLRVARALASRHASSLDAASKHLIDFWLGAALVGLGQPEKARQRLGRVYEETADPRVRCDAALELARSLRLGGHVQAAKDWVGCAEQLAVPDALLQARIGLIREEVRASSGEFEAARDALYQIHETSRRQGRGPLAARARASAARCELHLRRFGKARLGFEEALQLDRGMGRWVDLAGDLLDLGQTLVWDGRAQDARAHLEQALRYAQDEADSLTAAEATVHLGAAVALTSDPGEGMALVYAGAKLCGQVGAREGQLAANLHLLRISLMRRDAKSAAGLLVRCREDQKDYRSPLFKAVLEELEKQAIGPRSTPPPAPAA